MLIETAISGTDQAIPAEERDYVPRVLAQPRPGTSYTPMPRRCESSPSGWAHCTWYSETQQPKRQN